MKTNILISKRYTSYHFAFIVIATQIFKCHYICSLNNRHTLFEYKSFDSLIAHHSNINLYIETNPFP